MLKREYNVTYQTPNGFVTTKIVAISKRDAKKLAKSEIPHAKNIEVMFEREIRI